MMATGRVIGRLSQRSLLIFELHKGESKTVAVGKSLQCFENSQNVKVSKICSCSDGADFGLGPGAECTRSDPSRHGLNGLTCLNCLNIASSELP